MSERILVWFSCGAASAVAAKIICEKYGDRCEVLYCDTSDYEHSDNKRFLYDIGVWINKPIKILKSKEYSDIYDVFEKTKWLVGPQGARCTTEMKKIVRQEYQLPTDTHVFGLTLDEKMRVTKFRRDNFDLNLEFPLVDNNITKRKCFLILKNVGIELPIMYTLGYLNNNCIGCVKGGAGYWNKIRNDFPEIFLKMSILERRLDVAICKRTDKNGNRIRIFLDELPLNMGNHKKEKFDMECGVLCPTTKLEDDLFIELNEAIKEYKNV